MQKLLSGKNILIVVAAALTLSSCNKGGSGGKKAKSSVTGWNYDDKNMGNFHVTKMFYASKCSQIVRCSGREKQRCVLGI